MPAINSYNSRFIALTSFYKNQYSRENKFILVKDKETNDHSVVFIPDLTRHESILRWYSNNIGENFYICGGGKLFVDLANKEIKAYGLSGDYGKFKKEPVKEILEEELPGYTVIVE